VTERTNSWDAVGVVSYGLIFAFIESVVIFLVASLLGFLVSKKWSEDHRVNLMGLLVFITSLWAMASYLYFMLNWNFSGETILFIAGLSHPLRFLYAVVLVLVGLTMALPTYFILRSEKFLKGVQALFERLSMLTQFYLFFDIVGLVIVIVRNV
jgi:hypothetical protein